MYTRYFYRSFIDSLETHTTYVSVVPEVTLKNRQDTAACVSLSFVYNVKQRGAFRLRHATDNPLPGIPFFKGDRLVEAPIAS